MRIVIVNALYPPYKRGGAEKSTSLLAESLAARGDHVCVISLSPGKSTSVESRNGVRVYRVPLDNLYWPFDFGSRRSARSRLLWHIANMWNVRAADRVGRILDDERPDVMHTNVLTGFSPAVWRAARCRGIRVVHTLRDYSLLCVRSTLFGNGRFCARRCGACVVLTSISKVASTHVDAL